MKKLVLMAALFVALFATVSASAQGGPGGGDPAQMRQRMVERIKAPLIEKTKISDAEAEKVIDINMSTMQQRREIRMDNSSSDEDKAKKIAALDEEMTKKYKAIPLKDDQVKAVNDFFAEMRKNMGNRGPGKQ